MLYTLNPPEKIKFTKKDFSSYLQRAAHFKIVSKDQFFSNSPPEIFVGSRLPYPQVNVGILTPPEHVEDAWLYDAENLWPQTNLTINDIVQLRSSLINSRFKTNVYTQKQRFLGIAQEIGMASAPVDVEIKLKKKVKIKLDLDRFNKPIGPRAPLQNARITENTKITAKVDKVVSDTDLKASDAITYLYENSFGDNTLSQLLSLGVLGLKKNRKLVPTRWSITSTDDILGKYLINKIRDHKQIEDYQLYYGSYFGNYYYILLFPDVWSYELFELYLPGSAWNTTPAVTASTDSETYQGRKDYASNTAGGYYAARLPLLEHLNKNKSQASALIIRFETPEYHTGLGVWVVRSAARKAMQSVPFTFKTREEMLATASRLVKTQLNFDVSSILKKSKMLNNIKEQVKLTSFFNS